MRRFLAGAILSLCLYPALAEEGSGTGPAPNTSAVVDPKPVALGDRWTYEVKDEISGVVKQTRTVVVTDISKKEIATRFDDAKTGRSGIITYDGSWNILNSSTARYSPNDGSGVELPLAIGKTWKISGQSTNYQNGAVWRRSGDSRVTGQESITTKAGKFETFVIDSKVMNQNTKNPTQKTEILARTWYSPDVNHWVKRNLTIRQNGHTFQNDTTELTEFAHKK